MTAQAVLAFIIGMVLSAIWHDASAHDAPSGWAYPTACCSSVDCEPIPIDGIEEVKGGWRVHFVSPRFGPIDLVVPLSQVRDSQDGGFHGCWYRLTHKVTARCFFVPRNV